MSERSLGLGSEQSLGEKFRFGVKSERSLGLGSE